MRPSFRSEFPIMTILGVGMDIYGTTHFYLIPSSNDPNLFFQRKLKLSLFPFYPVRPLKCMSNIMNVMSILKLCNSPPKGRLGGQQKLVTHFACISLHYDSITQVIFLFCSAVWQVCLVVQLLYWHIS